MWKINDIKNPNTLNGKNDHSNNNYQKCKMLTRSHGFLKSCSVYHLLSNHQTNNVRSKISSKNHWCPQFLPFSTLCMRSMFLQVDANGLHENGDILPAIILLRVKTACPEKALNLLRGKMQARKKILAEDSIWSREYCA